MRWSDRVEESVRTDSDTGDALSDALSTPEFVITWSVTTALARVSSKYVAVFWADDRLLSGAISTAVM